MGVERRASVIHQQCEVIRRQLEGFLIQGSGMQIVSGVRVEICETIKSRSQKTLVLDIGSHKVSGGLITVSGIVVLPHLQRIGASSPACLAC